MRFIAYLAARFPRMAAWADPGFDAVETWLRRRGVRVDHDGDE